MNGELAIEGLTVPHNIVIYSIQGPFFFGVAGKIERAFAVTHSDPRIIIFRLKKFPFMDMTGLQAFREIIEAFHKRGVQIIFAKPTTKWIKN